MIHTAGMGAMVLSVYVMLVGGRGIVWVGSRWIGKTQISLYIHAYITGITGNPPKTKKRSPLPSTSRGLRRRAQPKTSANSRPTEASRECVHVLHVIMSITILCEIICLCVLLSLL